MIGSYVLTCLCGLFLLACLFTVWQSLQRGCGTVLSILFFIVSVIVFIFLIASVLYGLGYREFCNWDIAVQFCSYLEGFASSVNAMWEA